MLKREYEGQERCSVAMTLELVGERWTWLIIRDAFLGLTGSPSSARASASPATSSATGSTG